MTINLSLPQKESEIKPRITVVGVGGAGGNAVNNMISSALEGVEFIVANTDAQALGQSLADRRVQLGITITQGLGAGARPEVGRQAAEEALPEILQLLDGANMVFVTAGMGGGTGTGAAPVIAAAAREQGILTIGVVTKPFHFEGRRRMQAAEQGITELEKVVDTLIVIPNQNLFKMADDVLHMGVRGVTDLMVMPGLINLDFADIRTVMGEMGKAMMGTGEAEGEKRATDAAEAAISNPLLEDVSMKGARGVLINITGGLDMTLFEVDEAANRIREEVDPEANIIFGSTFDEKLEGKMRISVVATGIDAEAISQPRPTISLVSSREAAGPRREATTGGYTQPVLTQNAAQTLKQTPRLELDNSPLPQAAEAAENAAMRNGAFIAPKPVDIGAARPAALTQPAVPPAASKEVAPRPKGRVPSLIERVTGVGRARVSPPEPLLPPAQPAKPAVQSATQPRLAPLEPDDRPNLSKEDDLLDIPAFLRRQAN